MSWTPIPDLIYLRTRLIIARSLAWKHKRERYAVLYLFYLALPLLKCVLGCAPLITRNDVAEVEVYHLWLQAAPYYRRLYKVSTSSHPAAARIFLTICWNEPRVESDSGQVLAPMAAKGGGSLFEEYNNRSSLKTGYQSDPIYIASDDRQNAAKNAKTV